MIRRPFLPLIVALAALTAAAVVGCEDTNRPGGSATNNGFLNNGQTNNGQTNNGQTNNGQTNNGQTNNGQTNNGAGCDLDGDCAAREICEAGQCVAGCRDDADCEGGASCVDDQCVAPDLCAGVECVGGAVCDPTTGTCVGGGCEGDACPQSPCDDAEGLAARATEQRAAFDALSAGVATVPAAEELGEDTNGLIELSLSGDAFPLLVGPVGVHGAATRLGAGRVVAFSGQDFLSSGDRSTLLKPGSGVPQLVRNAARWTSAVDGRPLRVLADNDAVAAALQEGTGDEVTVTPIVERAGLREIRDWSATALVGMDVLVVQVNEWGTLHVADTDLAAIQAFVRAGGGLIIAGSALHWSWWLSDQGPAFPGDAILAEAGIMWARTSVRDLRGASLTFDAWSSPVALWCAYVTGAAVDEAALPRVGPLFQAAADAGRSEEVERGLRRLSLETPALPVSAANPAARLSAQVGVGLRGQAWPGPHPWASTFPGALAAGATRLDGSAEVDARWVRTQPLGFYAPPGEVVRLTFSSELIGVGVRVRVGDLHDDLGTIEDVTQWRRAPLLYSEVEVTGTEVVVGSGLGGALALEVPEGMAGTGGRVQISGGVPMAVYTAGVTSLEDFQATLAAGAPQAIFQTPGRVRMVVPSAEAAQVTDIEAVLAFWAAFWDKHFELSQEPAPRPFTSHWLFDPQVGWGYANATASRINFPLLSVGWALRTQTGDEDWWLFGHELGHQFQTSDWIGGDITEVAVNLFTMYTLNGYIYGGGNFETRGRGEGTIDHAALRDARWGTADLFGKLDLYRQLIFEFGWDRMREVFASYYDEAYPRAEFGGFMDGFALRFSQVVDRDLTAFFDHWEYPMSAEARQTIQSWGRPTWLPPGW